MLYCISSKYLSFNNLGGGMQDRKEKIRREIVKTQAAMAAIGPALKGSVNKVILGKKSRTLGDRTAYLLTYKGDGNRTKSIYVKKEQLSQVKGMIREYQKLKLTVNRFIELNIALFKIIQSDS